MPHPQSSPRGLFAKARVDVGSTQLSFNSTAVIITSALRIGTKATYFTSNSTGVKLGSLYISCNSTGNSNT